MALLRLYEKMAIIKVRCLIVILDNGNCAIDIKVDPDGTQRDVSNYLQLTIAAELILRVCVSARQPNTGGLVNELGMFKYISIHPVTLRRECNWYPLSYMPHKPFIH